MSYQIVNCGGHVEVLDEAGTFLFSADTPQEAAQEIREIEEAPHQRGA